MLRPVTGLFFLVAVLVPLPDALSARAQRHGPGPSSEPPGPRTAAAEGRSGPGAIVGRQKISNAAGGFRDTLEGAEHFGSGLAAIGDLDGDGIGDLAAGAYGGGEGGEGGGLWVLFLAADGTVRAQQKINAGTGGFTGALDLLDFFGCSVASLGDVDGDGVGDIAVGALGDDDGAPGPLTDRGAVWILRLRPDGTVKSHRKISATQGGFAGSLAEVARFGTSVTALGDLDGDGIGDLAVGAPSADGASTGAAWVLFLAADQTVKAYRKIDGGSVALDANDRFGSAVAGLGDLDGDGIEDLAVGADCDDDGGSNRGAVYVLFLAEDGTVREHRKISVLGGALKNGDVFGTALAAAGDRDGDGNPELFVGATGDDDGGLDHGAVWVLSLEPDGTVAAQRKISDLEGGFTGTLLADDEFGHALAVLGDLDGDGTGDLAVGVPNDDDGANGRGAVWMLFLDPDGAVAAQQRVCDSAGGFAGTLDVDDRFGGAVVALGDVDGDGIGDLAAGATFDDDGGHKDRGAVWILFLGATGQVKSYRKISATMGAFTGALDIRDAFGSALAAVGDLDGDGVRDLAVGAPYDDDGGSERGAVWILFLAADGSVKSHQKISTTAGAFGGRVDNGDLFGSALAPLGDLDGDGVGDLAVGAVRDDDGGTDRGAVWVLFLAPDGTVREHQKISDTQGLFTGTLRSIDFFGSALATLDDLDGNGIRELAVGAPEDDDGGRSRGAVWVLFLNADGTVAAHRKISDLEGGFAGKLDDVDLFGGALAAPGDLDGDGIGELAVGAALDDDGGGEDRGAVWVLFLAADGTVARHRKLSAARGLMGKLDAEDSFGSALAAPGDVDGDGIGDLVASAPRDDDGGYDHGALWLLRLDGVAMLGFEHAGDPARTPLANGSALAARTFGPALALTGAGANLGPALFDSTPAGPNDTGADGDLLVDLGNVLVLQDSLAPTQSVPGRFDRADDDPDGGTLTLAFARGPVEPRSLDLIDLDLASGRAASVTLLDRARRERVYSIPPGWTEDLLADGPPGYRTLDLTTLAPQPGFAATAAATQTAGFDPRAVVRIEIQLGGTGALDNLRWDPYPAR